MRIVDSFLLDFQPLSFLRPVSLCQHVFAVFSQRCIILLDILKKQIVFEQEVRFSYKQAYFDAQSSNLLIVSHENVLHAYLFSSESVTLTYNGKKVQFLDNVLFLLISEGALFALFESQIIVYDLGTFAQRAVLCGLLNGRKMASKEFPECQCLRRLGGGEGDEGSERGRAVVGLGCQRFCCPSLERASFYGRQPLDSAQFQHLAYLQQQYGPSGFQYSGLAAARVRSTMCVVAYGEVPEIIVYTFPCELPHGALVYPNVRVLGMTPLPYFDDTFYGRVLPRTSLCSLDLFADDVECVAIERLVEGQLHLIVQSDVVGLFGLAIPIAQETAGDFTQRLMQRAQGMDMAQYDQALQSLALQEQRIEVTGTCYCAQAYQEYKNSNFVRFNEEIMLLQDDCLVAIKEFRIVEKWKLDDEYEEITIIDDMIAVSNAKKILVLE